jgi:hypothetical protein
VLSVRSGSNRALVFVGVALVGAGSGC